MKITILLLLIFLMGAIFFACSSGTEPQESPRTKQTAIVESEPVEKQPWQTEWDKIREAARKEKRLVVSGGAVGPEVRAGLTEALKKKFDIEMELWTGRGAESVRKLEAERAAGIYSASAYLGGTTTPMIEMKPRGILDPLDKVLFLPEVVEGKNWRLFGLYFDKAHTIAGGFMTVSPYIYINTDLVNPSEVKTVDDLLNPRWKGKIAMNDPTTTGTGHSRVWGLKMARGEDFLRRLVEQKPVVSRDQRLLTEWIAQGKYAIGIAVPESVAGEFIKAGARMTAALAEEANITTGIGAVSLINRAAHPNAARVFLNWILTREGQSIFARLANHGSRRVDVDNEWLDPVFRPRQGLKYFFEDEDVKAQADRELELYKEIFKPVM